MKKYRLDRKNRLEKIKEINKKYKGTRLEYDRFSRGFVIKKGSKIRRFSLDYLLSDCSRDNISEIYSKM